MQKLRHTLSSSSFATYLDKLAKEFNNCEYSQMRTLAIKGEEMKIRILLLIGILLTVNGATYALDTTEAFDRGFK